MSTTGGTIRDWSTVRTKRRRCCGSGRCVWLLISDYFKDYLTLLTNVLHFSRWSSPIVLRWEPVCCNSWQDHRECRCRASERYRAPRERWDHGCLLFTWLPTCPRRTCPRRTPALTGSICRPTRRTSYFATSWRRPLRRPVDLPWSKIQKRHCDPHLIHAYAYT